MELDELKVFLHMKNLGKFRRRSYQLPEASAIVYRSCGFTKVSITNLIKWRASPVIDQPWKGINKLHL